MGGVASTSGLSSGISYCQKCPSIRSGDLIKRQVLHRSVGYIRIGEKKGLQKAIKMRNELGVSMWGKFWRRLLKDPYLMTRLPHSLEPKVIYKPRPTKEDPEFKDECYIAAWRNYDNEGKLIYKSVVCSIT